MNMLLSFIWGIYFKPHANLNSINGNIKESLTWIEGFWKASAIINPIKSRDSPSWKYALYKTVSLEKSVVSAKTAGVLK